MSEENKTVELKDEELEKVVGGRLAVGEAFHVCDAWPGNYEGEWFRNDNEPDIIYKVCSCGYGNLSFLATKYWCKDGEVWPCGSRSFRPEDVFLYVVDDPTVIHEDFTGTKPF